VSGHRSERVADLIRRELARLLQEELRDPRVGFVTLTGVDLSPDLKNARVYVSVLGEDHEGPLRALERATPFLRRKLAGQAGLRFTPTLRFVFDASVETGERVESILAELRAARSDDAGPGGPGEEDEAAD
jgi:ribosome-binding factor A